MSNFIFKLNYFFMKSSQLMQILHMPRIIQYKYNNFRHNIINHELKPFLNKAMSIFNNTIYYYSNNDKKNNKVIWTFWWQGEKSMPLVVRKCIESIKRNSNDHKVIVITKFNIHKYTQLPNYIYKKLYKGQISFTHFSDVLRFNLLRHYGGLWIDATIYCTSKLDNKYFKKFYTVNVGDDGSNFVISNGKWTSFLIGGDKEEELFIFMDIFYQIYWKNNSNIIDYFMMDYVFNYAYINNIGNFKYYVDKANYQPFTFELMNNMESKFDYHVYNIMTKNTECFKLTYKKHLSIKSGTFFYQFINNKL